MNPASSPPTCSSYLDAFGLSVTTGALPVAGESILATLRDPVSGPRLRDRAEERVAAGRHAGRRIVDLHHLVFTGGSGHQADVAAPDAEGRGHRPQGRLGRFPVDRPRGDGHHESVAVPSPDGGPRRTWLNADGYPHAPAGTAAAVGTGADRCIPAPRAGVSQRGSGSWAALMTTTGHGARRRQARITGPAERCAPGVSLTVPRTSMSAPWQCSSRTRAARPSTTWVRTWTPGTCSGITDCHMMSMSSSSGDWPWAGTA